LVIVRCAHNYTLEREVHEASETCSGTLRETQFPRDPGQPTVALVIVRCAHNYTLEREVHEASEAYSGTLREK
jgi:uncharacterized membrane protein